MKYLTKLKMYLISDANKRTNLLIKKNFFRSVGKNFFFQPRIIPDEPKLISFGNNVSVASGVTFVTHDVIDKVLNNMNYNYKFYYNCAPIKIGNNVFIGCNVTILPGVEINDNVIIAAGSVVTKDVKENTVAAGNPAKEISTFDKYVKNRKKINKDGLYPNCDAVINQVWESFENEKNSK